MATAAGASLNELREEDKLKIGNLLRELARAQRDGQQATRERGQYAARLQQMRSQNDLIVQVRPLTGLGQTAARRAADPALARTGDCPAAGQVPPVASAPEVVPATAH